MSGCHVEDCIRIAGVALVVRCGTSRCFARPDPIYAEFKGETSDCTAGPDRIEIELRSEHLPEVRGLDSFDTGQAWSLRRDDKYSYILFKARGAEAPHIIVRFVADVVAADVYCSDDYLNSGSGVGNPVSYPLDQILLMHYLSFRKGLILHSAGVSANGKAYIFPGWSGAGKSTLSTNLCGRDVIAGLSDDRIIIRNMDDIVFAFGTPWAGDARIASKQSARLSGIFFIVKSDRNRIEAIPATESFRRLMPVSSILWHDQRAVQDSFSLLEEVISRVPCHIFYCTPDSRAADCFEEFIAG